MLGTRTETKNVNSFRSVERAVRYEMQRHAAVLDAGGSILQETRHWHEDTGITTSGREKSDADDYRYFPEPDLVPVAPSREWVEELRGTLPENPAEKRARLQAEWGFSDLEMRDTVGAGALGLVEETVAAGAAPQAARKWWLGELARRANDTGVEIAELGVTPADVAARPGAGRRGHDQRQAGPPGLRRACSPARARPRRSSRPAAWRSSPTRAPCRPPSTTRSPPTPTSPTRSATARSPRPARSSAR